MTGGAAGALLCCAAGLSLGMALRERWQARAALLAETQELLTRLRLLLTQERLGMCELLEECACVHPGGMAQRFCITSECLRREPLCTLGEAYASACAQLRLPGEGSAEKGILSRLFAEMGLGSAAMKEAAVASCLRRLKPVLAEVERKAAMGSKLCIRLGLLGGLIVGIMLW